MWARRAVPQLDQSEIIWPVIQASLLYLIPQMGFAYYINSSLGRMLKREKPLVYYIFEIAIVTFIFLVLDRAISNYIVYPVFYYNYVKTTPLLDPHKIPVIILYLGYAAGLFMIVTSIQYQLAAKEREKSLTKEKLEAELKLLRNQTNPHFLFNTLNNIYALARKKSDKTPEVIMKLSELLSYMLYESNKESIAIEEEIKMVEDYIELQRIRYNDRLSVTLNKQLDDPRQPIAPLLLLPLVENAFKHGVSETRFDSYVNIDVKLEKRYLYFSIENSIENGNTKPKNGNIGLRSIRRQLELMYKEYNLESECDHKTFKVNISLNLDSYGKI